MKISKKALEILAKKLPAGSASKIQQILADKGDPYTLSYIYKVLNPAHAEYNPVIIQEAIKFAETIQTNTAIDPKDLEDQILRLG